MDTPPIDLKQLRKEARERFLAGRKAETRYGVQLRSLAKQIDVLVRGMAPDGVLSDPSALVETLRKYAETIDPWARAVAWRMINDVSARDAAAWSKHGRMIGRALRKEIEQAPTGASMRESLARQVRLIKSIPQDAAERVHKLTLEGITKGTRGLRDRSGDHALWRGLEKPRDVGCSNRSFANCDCTHSGPGAVCRKHALHMAHFERWGCATQPQSHGGAGGCLERSSSTR